MHITEGIITGAPAVGYTMAGAALVAWGIKGMKKFAAKHPEKKPLLGMAGAFIFFVSLLPIPAFTGTCSHPCGTPLAAIMMGPAIAIALTGISLLLQAAFFAHGGFSTWGANVIALGFFGCIFGWGTYRIARKAGLSIRSAGFLGGLLGDVMVYVAAGLILGTTLSNGPSPQFSFGGYLSAIYLAYFPTQGPIAFSEMLLTGFFLHYVYCQRPEVLEDLSVISPRKIGLGKSSVLPIAILACGITYFLVSPIMAEEGLPIETEQVKEETGFSGMDEAVNERLAEEAGRPAQDPYLNTESMGDIWNALLLIAGGSCGFILGRGWDKVFVKKDQNKSDRTYAMKPIPVQGK
jgi:cobalt/nickel transport system permease protein